MILDKAEEDKCIEMAKKYERLFEIEHLAKKNPYELSGGEKQRVAICRALVNNPDLILADEPTGNLDSVSTNEIMRLFKKLNKEQNITIIQVTHSSSVAEFGDKIICLEDGKIISDKKEVIEAETEVSSWSVQDEEIL
jgi:ABC-type lipoprotein export system ATPase subunit